jgi:hypothetical protein
VPEASNGQGLELECMMPGRAAVALAEHDLRKWSIRNLSSKIAWYLQLPGMAGSQSDPNGQSNTKYVSYWKTAIYE